MWSEDDSSPHNPPMFHSQQSGEDEISSGAGNNPLASLLFESPETPTHNHQSSSTPHADQHQTKLPVKPTYNPHSMASRQGSHNSSHSHTNNTSQPRNNAIPANISSTLSHLSNFQVSFALTDVASVLKYVLDELNLVKEQQSLQGVKLDQSLNNTGTQDLLANKAVEEVGELRHIMQRELHQRDLHIKELGQIVDKSIAEKTELQLTVDELSKQMVDVEQRNRQLLGIIDDLQTTDKRNTHNNNNTDTHTTDGVAMKNGPQLVGVGVVGNGVVPATAMSVSTQRPQTRFDTDHAIRTLEQNLQALTEKQQAFNQKVSGVLADLSPSHTLAADDGVLPWPSSVCVSPRANSPTNVPRSGSDHRRQRSNTYITNVFNNDNHRSALATQIQDALKDQATLPSVQATVVELADRIAVLEQRLADFTDDALEARQREQQWGSKADVDHLSDHVLALVKRLKFCDDEVAQVKQRLDGEQTLIGPVDGGALRRSVVGLNTKLRQMQDKVDTLSALTLTTRKQVAQIGSFETSSVCKSLTLRLYEQEMRVGELSDKLTLLAHYAAKHKSLGSGSGSAGDDDTLQLVMASKPVSTLTPVAVEQNIATLARDIEALSELQSRLHDARALLSRLEDLATLEQRVTSVLELDVPQRLAYIERRFNTEVSYLKAHLAGKVDQENLRALIATNSFGSGSTMDNAHAFAVAPNPSPRPDKPNKPNNQSQTDQSKLLVVLQSKADSSSVDKVEELVRALDRQNRDALMKLMSEVGQLKLTATSGKRGGSVQKPRPDSRATSASTDTDRHAVAVGGQALGVSGVGVGTGVSDYLCGPLEKLERQIEYISVTLASHEGLIARKADAEWVEELQDNINTNTTKGDVNTHTHHNDTQKGHTRRASTPAQHNNNNNNNNNVVQDQSSFLDEGVGLEVLTRLHAHVDELSRKSKNHREWISRNAQDINALRDWVKYAHDVLQSNQSTSATHDLKSLQIQVNTLQRKIGDERTLTQRKLPQLAVAPDMNGLSLLTSKPLHGFKCLSCDRELDSIQRVVGGNHCTHTLKQHVSSVVPAGGLCGTDLLQHTQDKLSQSQVLSSTRHTIGNQHTQSLLRRSQTVRKTNQ